ncbi:PspA/IM30 family protein [Catelliglobosispora koreensis]|uniref:PspA/IM30 family protein n=1 Tax=Catelliglobosispora koreensis TaxID=129052 RepID=UPI0003763A70|nr:PspA/IM30 family protein [Catelliglobosispora koreensis]
MPQTILGRITQMARANINAMLDSVEDPKVMLDQMVRDYTSSIKEAETAVATTIGNLRLLEQDSKDAQKAMSDWETKARAASGKAEELKKQGNTAEAEKFDDLARIALSKQIGYESDVSNFAPAIKEQTDVVEQLKAGLTQMHSKLDELKSKRNELANRQKITEARERVQDMTGAINTMDPTSELGRYEEMVRRAEARVKGKEELSAESIDARFESLVKAARDDEVEKRLAALK